MEISKICFGALLAALTTWSVAIGQEMDNEYVQKAFPGLSQRTQLLSCTPAITLSGCNHNRNNVFNVTPNSSGVIVQDDEFRNNNVAEWGHSHGAPSTLNAFWGIQPPVGATDAAKMDMLLVNGQFWSEGIVQKIPALIPGNKYLFSFYEVYQSIFGSNSLDEVNIYLIKCSDYQNFNGNTYIQPAVPANSQQIFCETNLPSVSMPLSADWKKRVVKFTANDNYDMLWVVPKKTTNGTSTTSYVFTLPELINVNNLDAGPVPVYDACNPGNVTIGPATVPNCSVNGAVFKWYGPNGQIITAPANQQISINPATEFGTWILRMEFPNAVTSNSTCGQSWNIESSVQVANPAASLQILNPTFDYEWDALPPMSLNVCEMNRLCNVPLNGDDFFYFTGTSNQANGNIWQIRKYNGPLYSNSSGIVINGTTINYPDCEIFTTYSTGADGGFELFTGASGDCNFEIKLINTITNTSQIIRIKVVMYYGTSEEHFYCVSSGNQTCPIPHKLIYAMEHPGYSYQWTLPTGMNPCGSLTNAWVTWDDANFNYNDPNHPPLVASRTTSNVFGCPSVVLNINIDPSGCIAMKQSSGLGEKGAAKEMALPVSENDNTATIFPNPAKESFRINTSEASKRVVIQAADGRIVLTKTNLRPKEEITIAGLRAGLYLVTVYKTDGTKQVYKLIKQ